MQVADFNSSPACFSFDSTGNVYLGTLDHGVYFSTNNGVSWTARNSGLVDFNIYSLAFKSSGFLFAGTFNHGVFVSSNNGSSWNQSGLTIQSKVRAIVITQSGAVIAGTDANGIYRSTNNGTNWVKMAGPLAVYSMNKTSNGYIIAGTRNPDCIYLSQDDGITWEQKFSYSNTFNSLASTYDGNVYSVTGDFTTVSPLGYILARSSNFGLTWYTAFSFPSSSYGTTVNIKNDLFIGRYYNVWKSTNFGANWIILSSGIDSSTNFLISLACSPSGYLYTGRQGGQLFRSVQNTIAVQPISSKIPSAFKLYNNYPNPFNPATKIRFDIPHNGISPPGSGNTTLRIYNSLGQEIQTLLSEKLKPGSYEVDWDGSNYPSGLYFYSLTFESATKTLPMILLK